MLIAFVGWHLWQTAAATGGRDRFVLRMPGTQGRAWAVGLQVGLVLVPLALHAVAGTLRARSAAGDAGGYGDAGSRVLQWVAAAAVVLFLAAHLAHTWVVDLQGAGPFGLYEALRTDLPHSVWLVIYVLGLTALAMHVAQGVGAFPHTWGLSLGRRGFGVWRAAGVVVAVALWVVAMNTVSYFATGEALLFRVEPLAPASSSPPSSGP